jgi:hypothetical protein
MALNPKPELVDTWGDYVDLVTRSVNGTWHFRGALDNWSLSPSLYRVAQGWGVAPQDTPNLEKRLLRAFRRAYPPNAVEPRPSDDDTAGWLALMQHYGAPTRLLDFTYSPFIAAFFALDALLLSEDPDRAGAVWALSAAPVSAINSLLPTNLIDAFKRHSEDRNGEDFRAIFFKAEPPIALVAPVNPFQLNQRLVVQQGLFLCPGDVRRTFVDNLLAVPGAADASRLRKILLPRSILPDALTSLYRMGSSHATLFPGIDGFSRGLRQRVGYLLSGQDFKRRML